MVLGVIERDGADWRLTVRVGRTAVAVIYGSSGYVGRALVALGLAAPAVGLGELRDGKLPLAAEDVPDGGA